MTTQDSVRRRLLQDEIEQDPDINNMTEEERQAIDSVVKRNKSNLNSHTICWMIAAMIVFNYTDFVNVIVNDSRVKYNLLQVGAGMIGINLSVGCYLVVYLSYFRGLRNWEAHIHPAVLPVATLFAVIGGVICTVALWPVWKFLTVPILFTLFMGIIMLVTLLPF